MIGVATHKTVPGELYGHRKVSSWKRVFKTYTRCTAL